MFFPSLFNIKDLGHPESEKSHTTPVLVLCDISLWETWSVFKIGPGFSRGLDQDGPFQNELFGDSVFLLSAHCKSITMESQVYGFPYAHVSQCLEFQNYMQHRFPGEAVHWSCSTPWATWYWHWHFLLPPAVGAAAVPRFITKSLRYHTNHELINQTAPVVTQSGGHWSHNVLLRTPSSGKGFQGCLSFVNSWTDY